MQISNVLLQYSTEHSRRVNTDIPGISANITLQPNHL